MSFIAFSTFKVLYFILFCREREETRTQVVAAVTPLLLKQFFFSLAPLRAMQWTRVMNKALTRCRNSFCASRVFLPFTNLLWKRFEACQPTPYFYFQHFNVAEVLRVLAPKFRCSNFSFKDRTTRICCRLSVCLQGFIDIATISALNERLSSNLSILGEKKQRHARYLLLSLKCRDDAEQPSNPVFCVCRGSFRQLL